VAALLDASAIERVFVNVQRDDPYAEAALASLTCLDRVGLLREAGTTRAETVRNALAAVRADVHADTWVLVHDAARPCLSAQALARLLAARAASPHGALLALPVADTLKRAGADTAVDETVPRDRLWRAQTPQMFRYGLLVDALSAAPDVTDEAQAVEALGLRPRLIHGEARNLKLTEADDLPLARYFMEIR